MAIVQHSFLDGKICTKCKEWKPSPSFNRQSGNGKLRPWCVECNRLYKAKHRHENREHINETRRAYYAKNRDVIRGKQKIAYDADPEKFRNRSRLFRNRFRDKALSWARRGYHANREHRKQISRAWYQAHKEYAAQRRREWVEQNRDRYRDSLRRAKGKRRDWATGATYRERDWLALRDWFGNICLCCGCADALQADHVRPLARGGTNAIENLQPLCGTCNRRKGSWRATDYRNPDRLAAFLASIGH